MTNPRVVVGIQARLSSSRLPCKAMLSMGTTSLLGFLIRRSLCSGYDTYLLTSDQIEDDILEREAFSANVTGVIRGSLRDVRSRFLTLSQKTKSDFLVRVTGDNPFTDFRAIKPLIAYMKNTYLEYAWLDPSCCPDGINLEVFTESMLQKSIHNSDLPEDLEHVTPWMKRYFNNKGLWLDWYGKTSSKYHIGIDTMEDYVKVLSLIEDNPCNSFFESPDTMDWVISRMINSPMYPKYRRHVI